MATIPLDLIPPFLAVAELGSFSTAAKRLGVEKSSVSRAVARLEQGVGDRLFLRTTRRVSLTDAGRSVRDQLREPHANLDAALRAVLDTASQPRGRIVVTTAVDFGAAILAEALARFVRRHPHVEVDVRASGQYLDLGERWDRRSHPHRESGASTTRRSRPASLASCTSASSPRRPTWRPTGCRAHPKRRRPTSGSSFRGFASCSFEGLVGALVSDPQGVSRPTR